jgi:arylsulfatase A-like enzyme
MSTKTQPNVLFIMSDQHHAKMMGCAGDSQVKTPHLDRLAAMGTRFDRAYTQSPICLPSRVSFLCGQYCHNHGHYGNRGPAKPANLPTFLGHFREHGYTTALIGKAHLPGDRGAGQAGTWGFDDCDVFKSHSAWREYLAAGGLSDDLKDMPQRDGAPSFLEYKDSFEGWAAQETIRFIEDCGEKPFCMEYSLVKPHHPLNPAKEFWDLYPPQTQLPPSVGIEQSHRPENFRHMLTYSSEQCGQYEPRNNAGYMNRCWRAYLACISHLDQSIGDVLTYLEESGKIKNTIIVYGSDHGAYMGHFGIEEKAPGICSDYVCRVPFLWYVPGITTGNEINDALVENIDLVPTITELCGLPSLPSADGVSLVSLLTGTAERVHDAVVTENIWSKAIHWDNWRLVHYQPEMYERDEGELYNLAEDPDERINLYHDPASLEIVNTGRALLLQWLIRTTRVVSCKDTETSDRSSLAGDGKLRPEHFPQTVIDRDNPASLNYL